MQAAMPRQTFADPDGMDRIVAGIRGQGVSANLVTADKVDSLDREKGAYLLLLWLERPVRLAGSNPARLQPGWYVYAGSAKGSGGIGARLRRHFAREKRLHWHIDRLTVDAASIAALAVAGGDECELVACLLGDPAFTAAAKGFGNTDCRVCESHLLRFDG